MNLPLEAFQMFEDEENDGAAEDTILKFPTSEKEAPARPTLRAANLALESFDRSEGRRLFKVAQQIQARSEEIIDFIHTNRPLAVQAGIETIGIEMSGILNSGKMERIFDALDDAAEGRQPLQLTQEGLAALRRLEKLLAEASANISSFNKGEALSGAAPRARERGKERPDQQPRLFMGDAQSSKTWDGFMMLGSAAIFLGAFALAFFIIKSATKD